jgi:hypothetical protein
MARTLSANMRRALFAPQTGQAAIVLLELSHPTMAEPIRVCSDGQDVVAGGHTYAQFPFELAMPSETDSAPPQATLRICGVSREITYRLRQITGDPLGVSMRVVLASSPDVIEAGPFTFDLREARYDAGVVEGRLRYEPILEEPFPADAFTPSRAPGLFKVGGGT